MSELLHTDFIKNKIVQICTFIGLIVDFILTQTMNHALILFALPYLASVGVNYLMMKQSPVCKHKPQISAEFGPSAPHKITITPK